AWVRGVPMDDKARQQLANVAALPFVHKWVAAMPDVHVGIGATVGSVIATEGAVIPAAVGVDIGCGMMATRTTLKASDLPDSLADVRAAIEKAVPHGRTSNGRRGDRGAWGRVPEHGASQWRSREPRFRALVDKQPRVGQANTANHLGTLGTGNHFIELCLDEADRVWVMLHSGSRGIGNRIGSYFIELAKKDLQRWYANVPDKDLAYFSEGSEHFADYIEAVGWAQDFARRNRETKMAAVLGVLARVGLPEFTITEEAVNC